MTWQVFVFNEKREKVGGFELPGPFDAGLSLELLSAELTERGFDSSQPFFVRMEDKQTHSGFWVIVGEA